MKPLSFAAYLLIAGMIAGCASTGAVDAVRRESDETKTRIYTLEKELASAKEVEKSYQTDMAELRKADADLQANIDSFRSELQVMAGKIEDHGAAVSKPAADLSRYREDTDRRIVTLEDRIVKLQTALDELTKRQQAAPAEAPQAAVKETTPDAPYLKGLEAFKAGNMAAARTSLSQFVEKNPDHELVSNARYWIGETYYAEKNYEQAILEFQEVVKQYPKKEKAPAAMLKQALSFKALKDTKSAQYLLKRLNISYPKSEEAKRAKELLKEFK